MKAFNMEASKLEHLAPRHFSHRLSRQNRYLDFLEHELDEARTETEARVVLSLLRSTRQRIRHLEERFVESCVV
jgi:hypothetical protein